MSYAIAKATKDALEAEVNAASLKLKDYPRGAMGLVPDDVRASAEFKADKAAFDKANRKAQNFNAWFMKNFKKEYMAERRAKGRA